MCQMWSDQGLANYNAKVASRHFIFIRLFSNPVQMTQKKLGSVIVWYRQQFQKNFDF